MNYPFLVLGITDWLYKLDRQTRMSEIIHGRRSISADTAVRLSIYFGNSANFWLGLQNDYDLEQEMKLNKKEFAKIGEAKYDRV